MAEPLLVLGNKKYSSWSLRAWIGLSMAGVAFREQVIKLFQPGSAEAIAWYSAVGKVPILVADGLTVHDCLAILEYANEAYAKGGMWPADPALRARARAVSAEMHAGFPNLRARMPMNLARPHAPLPPAPAPDAALQADLERVLSLWDGLLCELGGPYLFGQWSIADCMYLPVAARLRTYAVDCSRYPRASEYRDRLLVLPAFLRWEADGRAEPEIIAEDEV